MWDYSETLKEHFFNPRNVGVIENPDGLGEVGSLACGDALRLMFKLDQAGRIAEVKFQTFGCGSAIAASSALTEMIKGKTLEEAQKITNRDIADYLGGLPEQKMHCSVMGREALDAAIDNYRSADKTVHQLAGKVVCTCFGVTDEEIERAVRENNLQTVEQVSNYCKAGGGCGGCHGDIEKIISDLRSAGQISGPTVAEPAAAPVRKDMTNIQKIRLIQETLDRHVRPALQADGGDVELIDLVDNNRVVIAFRGMCAQCPTAEFTMREVVEAKLREFISSDLIVEEQRE